MRRADFARIFLSIFSFSVFASCHHESTPLMMGRRYGLVLFDQNSVLHQGGNLRLYDFPLNGKRRLIWPYMTTSDPVVLNDLIVFNGGASDDRGWESYPALFAFSGTGAVVELSQPIIKAMGGNPVGATNYAFQISLASNNVIELRGYQRPPVDMTKPISISTQTTKDAVLAMISGAKTNGVLKKYGGVEYLAGK